MERLRVTMRGMRLGLSEVMPGVRVGLLFVLWGTAWGQAAELPVRTVTAAAYRAQLAEAQAVVRACAMEAKACDAAKVGADDQVSDGGFEVHWDWLRGALDRAWTGDRAALMAAAGERLAAEAGESRAAGEAVEFAVARRGADEVLSQGEFRHVTEEAYLRRAMARVARWLGRVFGGGASLGRYAAWLGPVLEWGFCLAVVVGAVLWGMRRLGRERMKIALEGASAVREESEAARAWAEAARTAAEGGAWREAVHALYWASVLELEARRVWRRSRGRTPREYLRLLDAGSPYVGPVGGLTRLLERVWYGLGAAERGDYERALAFFEELRAA